MEIYGVVAVLAGVLSDVPPLRDPRHHRQEHRLHKTGQGEIPPLQHSLQTSRLKHQKKTTTNRRHPEVKRS